MRRHWSVLLIGALCMSSNVWAQTPEEKAADRFTNADLLAQAERDRRIFLGALIVGTSTTASLHDVETGRCIARWYFENEDTVYANIIRSMREFPEHRPVEVVFTLIQRECPELLPD